MDSATFIALVTAIAGILTASAAWIANYYNKQNNEKQDNLKIQKVITEINDFAIWYIDAKPALMYLCDSACKSVETTQVLDEYLKSTHALNISFNNWIVLRVDVINIIRKKYGEEQSDNVNTLMKELILFRNVHTYFLKEMKKSSVQYHKFCVDFMKNCPPNYYKDLINLEKGNSLFTNIIRNRMNTIEESYKNVNDFLELKLDKI